MWFWIIGAAGAALVYWVWKERPGLPGFQPFAALPNLPKPQAMVPSITRTFAEQSASYALQNVTNPVTLIDLSKKLVAAGYGDLAVPLVLKAESLRR